MFRFLHVIVLAGMSWFATGILYSGEEASPRSILDKAIKAHGGQANLSKYPAVTSKGSGTFHGLGEGIPYTLDLAIQGPTQQSLTIETKINNMTFKFQRVVNGDKGWIKLNDDPAMDMDKEELAEEKEKLFAGRVASLSPLSDKTYKLDIIGEAKVGEKPAIAIRVSKKDHRDVNLYFDKQSNMLVKSETQVKDVKAGEEYTQTILYDSYKEFKGVKHATKIIIQKDGKRLVEAEMTNIQPVEKLEAGLFKQP